MNRLIPFIIFLFLLLLTIGCEQQPDIQPSGKTIKVGVIGPFSGPDQAKGKNGLQGIKAAKHLQPYLINGDAIQLLVADDKNDPAETVTILKKLTQTDNVSAVIILSSSAPVLAVAPHADSLKTPILALLATNPEITSNNTFISQVCFDDIFQGTVAALFVRDELLIDQVAVFRNPDNPYSRFLADEFIHKFTAGGGRVTDVISVNQKTSNLPAVLQDIRAHNADLLYLPIKADNVIKLITAAREISWNPKMMGSDGLLSTALTQHQNKIKLLEGIMATDFYSDDMPLSLFGEKIEESFDTLFTDTKTSYTALGAEGYALLQNAMNRCKNKADRICINTRLHQTRDFTGMMGQISIQQNGKASRPIVVNTIEDGEMEFIVKVY